MFTLVIFYLPFNSISVLLYVCYIYPLGDIKGRVEVPVCEWITGHELHVVAVASTNSESNQVHSVPP